MLGKYDLGAGLGAKTYTDDYMTFFRGGQVNPPRRGHAIWFMTPVPAVRPAQGRPAVPGDRRPADPPRHLREGRGQEGIPVPDDDMAPFNIKLDNTTFDPKKPVEEVNRV